MIIVKCVVCGKEIEPRRRDIKYCGSACRQKAYRDRNKLWVDDPVDFRLVRDALESHKRYLEWKKKRLEEEIEKSLDMEEVELCFFEIKEICDDLKDLERIKGLVEERIYLT